MSDTGWLQFTSCDDGLGGDAIWHNPTHAIINTSPFSYASTTTAEGYVTNFLKLYNIAGLSIPAGSFIMGIELRFYRKDYEGHINDNVVQLHKSGALAGDNKASIVDWPTSEAWSGTYGGPTDLWGTSYGYADVNDANFGVKIQAIDSVAGSTHSRIHQVDIKIYYSQKKVLGALVSKVMGVTPAKVLGV